MVKEKSDFFHEEPSGPPQVEQQLRARAFGRPEDLDVDFQGSRPEVVTRVLANCVEPGLVPSRGEAEVWAWTVATRMQALLAVAEANAVASVSALARCARRECREQLELSFELASFVRNAGATLCKWSDGTNSVTLRIPTGDDQRRWLESLPAGASALPPLMAASLVQKIDGDAPMVGWQLPLAWLDGIEAVLAEHDPLTDFELSANCPRCGDEIVIEADVEEMILLALERAQRDLLHEVDALAAAYHWSEADIVALPAWRRAYYLAAVRA